MGIWENLYELDWLSCVCVCGVVELREKRDLTGLKRNKYVLPNGAQWSADYKMEK